MNINNVTVGNEAFLRDLFSNHHCLPASSPRSLLDEVGFIRYISLARISLPLPAIDIPTSYASICEQLWLSKLRLLFYLEHCTIIFS